MNPSWERRSGGGETTHRQTSLFPCKQALENGPRPVESLVLAALQLRHWQEQLARFQSPLFAGADSTSHQGELFGGTGKAREPWSALAATINPLALKAQALSFWRWPSPPQRGAALYFVVDASEAAAGPLLLYVGETGRADLRWKGEHDCKTYLAAYSEAMGQAGLACRLSIRFWLDAPTSLKGRRALEQALIQRWLPPFNKESRQRWVTPFTAPPS